MTEPEVSFVPSVGITRSNRGSQDRTQDHRSLTSGAFVEGTSESSEDSVLNGHADILKLFKEEEIHKLTHHNVHKDGTADVISKSSTGFTHIVHHGINLESSALSLSSQSFTLHFLSFHEANEAAQEERCHVGWPDRRSELLSEHADALFLNLLQLLLFFLSSTGSPAANDDLLVVILISWQFEWVICVSSDHVAVLKYIIKCFFI